MKAEVTITVTKEGHVLGLTNTLPADEFNNTFLLQLKLNSVHYSWRKRACKGCLHIQLLENGVWSKLRKTKLTDLLHLMRLDTTLWGEPATVREKAEVMIQTSITINERSRNR